MIDYLSSWIDCQVAGRIGLGMNQEGECSHQHKFEQRGLFWAGVRKTFRRLLVLAPPRFTALRRAISL
jgi:hypothetical protein